MIQYDVFEMSKGKARLKYGRFGRDYFVYLGDVKRQWEKSYSHSKMLELVGSQSGPAYNLPDVEKFLGVLSADEEILAAKMRVFYQDLAKLISTSGEMEGLEVDVKETLLDLREIERQVKFPCRVLDIGPGMGRHMVALFQDQTRTPKLYASVDSVGMPYVMQNLAAGLLNVNGLCKDFHDLVDYEFDRKPVPHLPSLAEGSIVHVPLWQAEFLPSSLFDLVICTYVLDELSSVDFLTVCDILQRCVRPGGVVYCRGGQERAAMKDLYLYGFGTFHGLDITATMRGIGLVTTECAVKASKLTRCFVLPLEQEPVSGEGHHLYAATDQELIPALQHDYINKEIAYIASRKRRILLWTDPGYPYLREFLGQHLDGLKVVGITTRQAVNKGLTPMGIMEYPVEAALAKKPDVVIIVSNKMLSILREIREHSQPGEFSLMRSFTYPVAFAYRGEEDVPR